MEETNAEEGINISNGKLPQDKSAILIVVSDIQNKPDLFESIFEALKDEGFIITTVPIDETIPFEQLGFNICFSRIVNDTEKIVLLSNKISRKPIRRAVRIKNDEYSWIKDLQNALSDLESDTEEKLVIFAEKEPTSGILGLFNCLKLEQKGSKVSCFLIIDDNVPTFSLEDPFYKSQIDKNLSYNVYKDGQWGAYWHLVPDMNIDVEPTHAFCMPEERGNFSSFKWVQGSLDPSTYDNSNGKMLVHVYYSSLNFKDIMLSVGRLSLTDSHSYSRLTESYLGNEFSGKNEDGDRIMGMVSGKGIATIVECIPAHTWRVPDTMTLEQAATIPVVYCTVIYAFFFKMQLKEGCSVLIHSGSGGIGQAAINICLHYKCNIFTTVGTPEKVEFIKKTFPQIPESHIGNSRDTSFLKMIIEQTEGKGVDVVLNSLAQDKLQASVLCVATGGNFLEIGKFDMVKNNYLELGHFLNDISFHSVQLDMLLFATQNEKINAISVKLQEMLDHGIIKPINTMVFQTDQVEEAFRLMASGKHIGKLVIKIRDEEQDLKLKPSLNRLKAYPRIYCHKNKSYVILGGLGGIGMELADWLITRGARNILLSSRTGIKNGYQSYRIKLWRSYGTNVVISTANIAQESGVKEILETANSLGPVAGIFNLAMILKDDAFTNLTEESFKIVADPKAIATDHLDRLSRKMCPHLEYFVVFSSIACGYGNRDQTNYGFANSVMERICELRRADNLPGLAIQWGAIGEVGYVSALLDNNPSISIRGFVQQRVKSCLETMNRALSMPNSIVATTIIAKKYKTNSDIIATVANALGIKDLKTISMTWTLPELGMDSIMALELKQILEAEFDIFLTPEDLRTMTFAKLQKLKEEKENPSKAESKLPTAMQIIINQKLWNRPIHRLPLIDGNLQEQLPINENATVFVFPGVEALALAMEPLAKNLPIQTLCFQYSVLEDGSPLQTLWEQFSSYILENLQPEHEFCLIGYSYGGAIALEVAEILEKHGRKGRIWLIEGSPVTVRMITEQKKQNIPHEKFDEHVQNEVCHRLITTLVPELPKDSYSLYLEKAPNWETKKKVVLSIFSKVTKTENFDNRLPDKLLYMVKVLSQFEKVPGYLLQSSCVLIRGVQNNLDLPLDESLGLTQFFENPVEVHKIDDVDHFSIPSDPKTAEIIMNTSPWKKDEN